jgi:predicted Zn-dependent protease
MCWVQYACAKTASTGCRRWVDKSRRDVLQMVLAEIHIAEQEYEVAYELLKPVCYRWPDSTHVWNTYCRSAYLLA